ncbi:uncharacterized protein MONBRDRAFT_35505 [Monosiga brevicollis MX1]|uniref:Uncharacterized protein n=1 Tax=Monosiga brevicollis TaxID=81824 RepID=A9UPI8_MONBE|nr:uncharacterized protein MONBRDRAFT_35505 [Monosiga brevicollis MX1]EDQ92878.1 predicted protein [Monosiga brevicollis MX1]|eukprot:XP_001742640.1 hypothetical protein [Monosiga brevicollis MX1]
MADLVVQPLRWAGTELNTEDGPYREVFELVAIEIAEGDKLGLVIVGGSDDPDAEQPGLVVTDVVEETAAYRDGRIQANDEILMVNEQAVDPNATHSAHADLLRNAVMSGRVELKLRRVIPADQVDLTTIFAMRHGVELPDGSAYPGTVEYMAEGVVLETLELDDLDRDFGLALIGPRDEDDMMSPPGVYIAAILATGAAARSSRLHNGMQILEVNGWNVSNASVAEVEAILNVVPVAVIVATSNPEGYMPYANAAYNRYWSPVGATDDAIEPRKVVLTTTEENRRLGMTIAGPRSDFDMTAAGTFVTDILPGGAAERCGSLQVGDQILDVNGVCLYSASHEHAKRALLDAGTSIKLLVMFNPQGRDAFTFETEKIEAFEAKETLPPMPPRPVAKQLEVTDKDWRTVTDTVKLHLAKTMPSERLGMSVYVCETPSRTAVLVSNVFKGSVAAVAGLVVGQELKEVNGTLLAGMEQSEVVALLKTSELDVVVSAAPVVDRRLLLQSTIVHHTTDAIMQDVPQLVTIDARDGLGFAYTGPASIHGAHPNGVFVTRLLPGAPANLEAGDRILAIFDPVAKKFQSVAFATQEEVGSKMLAALAAHNECHIVVVPHPEAFVFSSSTEILGARLDELYKPANQAAIDSAKTIMRRAAKRLATLDHTQLTISGNLESDAGSLRVPFHVQACFAHMPDDENELHFRKGDILEVTDLTSIDQWTATLLTDEHGELATGLIPSPSAYEGSFRQTRRYAEQERAARELVATIPAHDVMTRRETMQELMAVHSYVVVERREQVIGLRPVAVYGPGADYLALRAVRQLRDVQVTQPLRCTSRPRRENERQGREYEFVSQQVMEERLKSKQLVEVGRYKDNLYGTSIDSIKGPAEAGRLLLMHCHPPAIRRLQFIGDVHPLVIFLHATPEMAREALEPLANRLDIKEEIDRAYQIDLQYSHIFTHRLDLDSDLDGVVKLLADIIEDECRLPFWAPINKSLPHMPAEEIDRAVAALSVRNVTVAKGSDNKFGFETLQPKNEHYHVLQINAPGPEFVSEEMAHHNDIILAINGQNMICEPHSKVKDALKKANDVVHMVTMAPVPGIRTVNLRKRGGGYGMTIQSHQGVAGVIVGEVTPGSPAAMSETIQPGDLILAINGKSMLTASHDVVLSILRTERNVAMLVVSLRYLMSMTAQEHLVPLVGLDDRGLGVILDFDGPYSVPIIKGVVPGSPAAVDGTIQTGWILIEVNNLVCRHATREQIERELNYNGQVELLVSPPPRPIEAGVNMKFVRLKRERDGAYGLTVVAMGKTLYVGNVVPDSPAAKSGQVQPGDELLEINGKPVAKVGYEGVTKIMGETSSVELRLMPSNLDLKRLINATYQTPEYTTITCPPDYQNHRRVIVQRDGPFGLKLEAAEGQLPVIDELTTGGAAAKTGQLMVGDTILAVNGEKCDGLTFEQVVQRLAAHDVACLDVAVHRPIVEPEAPLSTEAMYQRRLAVINRPPTGGLGLAVETKDDPLHTDFPRITQIKPDSPAGQCPNLFVGDYILSINGRRMHGVSQELLIETLKSYNRVELEVVQARVEEEAHSLSGTLMLTTTLHRGPAGLGLELITVQGEALPLVKTVFPGSVAAEDAIIERGDRVVKINDVPVAGKDHDDVIELLTSAESVRLELLRERVTRHISTSIPRGPSGYGLQLTSVDDGSELPFVGDIIAGGAVDQNGVLCVGDVLLAINGTSLKGLQYDDVLNLIKDSPSVLSVDVAREDLPTEVARLLDSRDDEEPRHVRLEKNGQGLGIKVTTVEGFAYPVIQEVIPGGTADRAGDVRANDAIVSINGASTQGKEHDEIIQMLQANEVVELDLLQVRRMSDVDDSAADDHEETSATQESVVPEETQSAPMPAGLRVVTLHKRGRHLGIKIQTQDELEYPYVGEVLEGGVAKEEGSLQQNDIILEINGLGTGASNHDAVVQGLVGSDTVALTVRYPTEDELAMIEMAHEESEAIPEDVASEHSEHASEPDDADVVGPSSTRSSLAIDPDVVRVVELDRSQGRLGLKIATPEHPESYPVITDILEDGSAAHAPKLLRYDAILKVNGTDTCGLHHEDIVALLSSATQLKIEVQRNKLMLAVLAAEASMSSELEAESARLTNARVVSLTRGDAGLGMEILTPPDDEFPYPVVGQIFPGAAAANSRVIETGDLLVAIGDREDQQLLRGLPHDHVVQLLTASTPIMLRVAEIKPAPSERSVLMAFDEDGNHDLSLNVSQAHYPSVRSVGPMAAAGGVQEGDIILRVNSITTEGMLEDEFDSIANKSNKRLKLLVTAAASAPPSVLAPASQEAASAEAAPAEAAPAEAAPAIVEEPATGPASDKAANGQPQPEGTVRGDSKAQAETEGDADTAFVGFFDIRRVPLNTSEGRLGIKITTMEETGLTQISDVLPEGVVAATHQVRPGDFILKSVTPYADLVPSSAVPKVDAHTVRNLNHDQVLQHLTASPEFTLTVGRRSTEEADVDAEIAEAPAGSQDVHIKAHIDRSQGNGTLGIKITTEDDTETVIVEVLPGGAVAEEGQLQAGDRLIAINGTNVQGADHDTVLKHLSSASELDLEVVRSAGGPITDALAVAAASLGSQFLGRDLQTIHLTRPHGSSWGLSIIALGENLGVLLTGKADDSPASRCNDLQPFSTIVKINNENVLSASHSEVVQLISSTDDVTLEVLPPDGTSIALLDAREGPLGIKIVSNEDDNCVRVSELIEGGQADEAESINVGDIIVSVNHVDLRGKSHLEVVGALRACRAQIVIQLQHDDSPLPVPESES